MPEHFPLAAGLPRTNDDGTPVVVTDRPTWTDVELCGRTVWSMEVPVAGRDLAGASYTGPEDIRSRVIAVYDDSLDAQQALDTLRSAYAACPEEDMGGTGQVYEVVEDEQGSATITHRYRTGGQLDTGLEVIEVVAIGNALYLSSYYGEGGGSGETIASAIELAHQESRPVWRAMAVFADPTGPADPAPQPTDLADVDLGAGWPDTAEPGEAGTVVPVTDSEPDVERDFGTWTCGAAAPEAGGESLRGRYANVEDYRARRLAVFDDADQAVAFVASLRAFYLDCPEQTANGSSYPVVLAETAVGGESFGVVRFAENDSDPMVGLMALHVVRVGRSVLLDAVSNEGGAGQGTQDRATREQVDRMTADSADVVASMCAFTEAGC